MRQSVLLVLALKSLLNRKATAILTVLAVAVSVMLLVGVERVRQSAEESFERTISGADLIVGARSGPINLVLYSVFHIGDPTSNISWESYSSIAARPEIAWAIPISLGDSHRGYRVVGTEQCFLEHYRFGEDEALSMAQGAAFSDLFDAVLGADVAAALGYKVGDEIVLSHGLGEVSFSNHEDKPFRVSGILKRTGTPVDRSIHVSLKAITAIHVGWQSGTRSPSDNSAAQDMVREMDLTPDSITAVIIGLKSRPAVLRLQRTINTYTGEPLLAVIPGVALSQLWDVVGVVETTLSAISACVVAVGLVVVLVSIMTSLNERRREMAILRSVGAKPVHIFFLLVLEAAVLALAGTLVGLALLYGTLAALSPVILSATGIALGGIRPDLFDIVVVGTITFAAGLLAALPAWRAYRNALADGLTVKV